MGVIYYKNKQYASGGDSADGVTIEEITYDQYLANKEVYDASDNIYWINDYPDISGGGSAQTAEQTYFDDTEAQTGSHTVQGAIEKAMSIAKGRNQAHVFNTTTDMQTWLSNSENIGKYNVGDNVYIVEVDVPDWWISEVLTEVDSETGYYYKIKQLEIQKVDLTEIESKITTAQDTANTAQSTANAANTTATSVQTRLNSIVVEEKKAAAVNITANGYVDFTLNVAKSGYTCISATLRSSGSYNAMVIGGGLTDATTFKGSLKSVATAAITTQPLVSCIYLKN